MSNETYNNCEEIIARAKIFLNVNTGKDLADALGVSENAISTWKKRGTLDMGKILLKCEGINQEWLLTGKGQQTVSINNAELEESKEMIYKLKYDLLMEKYVEKSELVIELQQQLLFSAGEDAKKPEGFPKKRQG